MTGQPWVEGQVESGAYQNFEQQNLAGLEYLIDLQVQREMLGWEKGFEVQDFEAVDH